MVHKIQEIESAIISLVDITSHTVSVLMDSGQAGDVGDSMPSHGSNVLVHSIDPQYFLALTCSACRSVYFPTEWHTWSCLNSIQPTVHGYVVPHLALALLVFEGPVRSDLVDLFLRFQSASLLDNSMAIISVHLSSTFPVFHDHFASATNLDELLNPDGWIAVYHNCAVAKAGPTLPIVALVLSPDTLFSALDDTKFQIVCSKLTVLDLDCEEELALDSLKDFCGIDFDENLKEEFEYNPVKSDTTAGLEEADAVIEHHWLGSGGELYTLDHTIDTNYCRTTSSENRLLPAMSPISPPQPLLHFSPMVTTECKSLVSFADHVPPMILTDLYHVRRRTKSEAFKSISKTLSIRTTRVRSTSCSYEEPIGGKGSMAHICQRIEESTIAKFREKFGAKGWVAKSIYASTSPSDLQFNVGDTVLVLAHNNTSPRWYGRLATHHNTTAGYFDRNLVEVVTSGHA